VSYNLILTLATCAILAVSVVSWPIALALCPVVAVWAWVIWPSGPFTTA
jgi:hypothetical protein